MNPQNIPNPEGFRHHTDLQIRFSDVDVLGHVNNTVYFSYYDTGKAYFFSDIIGKKIDWQHVETVIANVDCAYVLPVFFGEQIEVLTRCESISEKSFKLLQLIVTKDTGMLKSACETVMVSFDKESGKAVALPQAWREALEKSK